MLSRSRKIRELLGVDGIWNRYERITSVLRQAVEEFSKSPSRNKNCLLSAFLDTDEYKATGKLHF